MKRQRIMSIPAQTDEITMRKHVNQRIGTRIGRHFEPVAKIFLVRSFFGTAPAPSKTARVSSSSIAVSMVDAVTLLPAPTIRRA